MNSLLSYAHHYPLGPCGGLFVLTVGLGIILGAAFPRFKDPLLVAGAAAAVAETWVFGASLTAPLGVPSSLQLWSLFVAVAFEIIAIVVVVARFRIRGDRDLRLGILLVVGTHFLLMTPAFGSLMALLGILTMLNALMGLRSPELTLRTLWLLDGSLKLAIGAVLWLIVPRWA